MKKYDFSGYATRYGVECTDGRTILTDAFKHMDGKTVPLVWQHRHDDPSNVLGHALLKCDSKGVRAYGTFNNTAAGKNAKELVANGDVVGLSIYANQLKQIQSNVTHGQIRELSIVLAGANPGAFIDNVTIQHGDITETITDEADIYNEDEVLEKDVEVSEKDTDDITHEDAVVNEKSAQEIFDTLDEEQKQLVYTIAGYIVANKDVEHSNEEENSMKTNVFDNKQTDKHVLSHDNMVEIMNDAMKCGSLKKAVLAHAEQYGIVDAKELFPDAKAGTGSPEILKREDDWVAGVLAACTHSPFSRVKTNFVDMDIATARAKGYVKGTEKKEVFFKASKRVVTPTTIYVKQKLDRDDILDITDFDTVGLVRLQLRTLLEEELATSILLGDGREPGTDGKISEENIIPVYSDEALFTVREELSTKTDYKAMIKEIALTHKHYKGSGNAVFYTTPDIHTNMLWVEDENGRRIYESDATLCAALRVSKIVEVPTIEGRTKDGKELLGIKVNLRDYKIGADKGGVINSFDDFDIDFNQYKYLMETRCSGALTKAKSAQVFEFKVTE